MRIRQLMRAFVKRPSKKKFFAVMTALGWHIFGWVVVRPVVLLGGLYIGFREWLEGKRLSKKEAFYLKISDWIAECLRAKGIMVFRTRRYFDGVVVEAEILKEKIADYQEVYAAAVKRFSNVPPEKICGYTKYLDQAWAKRYGVSDWAKEIFSPPCVDCGTPESRGWRFGREVIKLHEYVDMRHTVSLKNGSKRVIDGHICPQCLNKIGWQGMSSRPRPQKTK